MSDDATMCPACSSPKFIYVELFDVYDGALYCECQDCGHAFHRFPEGYYLHRIAAPYIEKANAEPLLPPDVETLAFIERDDLFLRHLEEEAEREEYETEMREHEEGYE